MKSTIEGANLITSFKVRPMIFTAPYKKYLVTIGILLYSITNAFCAEVAQSDIQVTSVPADLRKADELSVFYQKYVDANGLPILGSERVSDEALIEAANIVNSMLKNRNDLRDALIQNHVRVAVMAPTEQTTDIPEHSDLRPKAYWDRRARGLGATASRPASSCAEENLLNLSGDRYANENILTHEFAHTIHLRGLNTIDPTFDSRLQKAYQHALSKGLWANTYAGSKYTEYWAETVQSYFDSNAANNAQHNDISTHEKLAKYDQEVFALIDEVFHQSTWRYVRYDVRHGKIRPLPNQEVRVVIANNSTTEASIFWLGNGTAKLYRKLAPGQSYLQSSSTGQKWQATFQGEKDPIDFVMPAENGAWAIQ